MCWLILKFIIWVIIWQAQLFTLHELLHKGFRMSFGNTVNQSTLDSQCPLETQLRFRCLGVLVEVWVSQLRIRMEICMPWCLVVLELAPHTFHERAHTRNDWFSEFEFCYQGSFVRSLFTGNLWITITLTLSRTLVFRSPWSNKCIEMTKRKFQYLMKDW